MWFETVPTLKVLVLKSRFVIPIVLQCPRDTVLFQSHRNFDFPWCVIWSSWRGGLCILEQISSLFYTLLMDPLHWYLDLLTNYRNLHYGNTSSWKFSIVTSVIISCHVTLTFYLFVFLASFSEFEVRAHLPNFSITPVLEVIYLFFFFFALSCSH